MKLPRIKNQRCVIMQAFTSTILELSISELRTISKATGCCRRLNSSAITAEAQNLDLGHFSPFFPEDAPKHVKVKEWHHIKSLFKKAEK
jgi:hypothetical protein